MSAGRIERTDHLTRLGVNAVKAGRHRCAECRKPGPGGQLLVFSTIRGRRSRVHDGVFCSKLCHDIFHGLKPRPSRGQASPSSNTDNEEI